MYSFSEDNIKISFTKVDYNEIIDMTTSGR